jgi:hypothetical protein
MNLRSDEGTLTVLVQLAYYKLQLSKHFSVTVNITVNGFAIFQLTDVSVTVNLNHTAVRFM